MLRSAVTAVIFASWLGWAWLASAGSAIAEQVEVTADSAQVKVRDDVITIAMRGERFEVLQREGPWVAVAVSTPDGDRAGWIFATQVRAVVEPGLDQESTAPGPYESVRADVGSTQFTSSKPTRILFELTLVNKGTKAVRYDASTLTLEVGNKTIKLASPTSQGHYSVHIEGPAYTSVSPSLLNWLGEGEIAPGGSVSGWVSFDVPQISSAGDSLPERWVLTGSVGGWRVQLDLRQREIDAIGAKIRPSTIDPSIEVLEIGSRVNALNVEKLIEARQTLAASRKPYIVLLTTDQCLVDELASRQLSSVFSSRPHSDQPFLAKFHGDTGHRLQFHSERSDAQSEAAVAVQVLGQRPSSGPQLVKHLTDASAATRAATAYALAGHLGEQGVVDAILRATDDDDHRVRTAAIQSLADPSGAENGPRSDRPAARTQAASPPQLAPRILEAVLKATTDNDASVRSAAVGVLAGSDGPRATQTLLGALADSDATVRTSAARAAGSHPAELVAEPLLGLLNDPEWAVAAAAATSLGRLKSEPAVPRLRELASGDSKPLAAAAIDALKAIGDLTELEAAIGKIDVAPLSPAELAVLAHSKDKRVVTKLIAAMQSQQGPYYAGLIAQTLGEIGDPDAVQPLINQLNPGNYGYIGGEVPRALGKLGDKRAIEPLQQLLARLPGPNPQRTAVQEALLMLDAPGALDQLAAALKANRSQYEAQQILDALGRAGGDPAVGIVAPYLDDARLCQYAAGALLTINSDEALAEIKKRLCDKDYPHALMVASRLIYMPIHSPGLRAEVDPQKSERIAALLEELGDSPNPAIQRFVRSQMANLERRIVNEELREFQSRVRAKQIREATELFEAAVQHRLETVGENPRQAARLTMYVSTMQQALSGIGEPEVADQLLTATLTAIEAEAKKSGHEELLDAATDIRGQRLMAKIRRGLEVKDEMTQHLSDVKRQLTRKAESGLTSADLDSLMQMGQTLEHGDRPELAADVYRTVVEAIHGSGDEQLARITEMLEGTIRRMSLLGNPIALSGTTVDGRQFDWESYRGKVVLVDFWATWCGPCLREVPNVRKNYELYHDRGFDVVGISLDGDRQALEQYLDNEKLPWVTLHDQDSDGRHPAATQYGISSIPTFILVDREGKVISLRARGEQLKRLLGEQLGPVTDDEVTAAEEPIRDDLEQSIE